MKQNNAVFHRPDNRPMELPEKKDAMGAKTSPLR